MAHEHRLRGPQAHGSQIVSTLRLIAAILAILVSMSVHGHATSTSYLVATDTTADGNVRITWDLSVAELHWAVDLDDDGDGRIRWSEIEAHRAEIGSLALDHLLVAKGGRCDTRPDDFLLATRGGEPHVSLGIHARCRTRGPLELSADLFLRESASQRTLIDVTTASGEFTAALSPGAPRWVEPESPSVLASFAMFVAQGTWHVWIGYDHLAFLFLLLLPSVRFRSGLGEVSRELLQIVSAFTVAHSITLALAVTDAVRLPVRPVEMAIAASIVVAGALNLSPAASRWRLPLAFGFGLVHGFGFANALAEIGSHGGRLVPVLAGFNIGVELAQLSVIAVLLPLLLRMRASPFYAARFLPAASMAMMLAGAAWFAARA
jgi:hypothetical protein